MIPMAMTAALVASSCFYDPDRSRIPDEGDSAGNEAATESESAGHDGGTASGWAWSGLGMDCEAKSDACAGYEADYCLVNPTNPGGPGKCTITGCDDKGCPDDYLCCDCSAVGMEIMCVPDFYEALIGTYCQCSI
jgi:hypothetical protein